MADASIVSAPCAPYSAIAAEYYDRWLHPTCANFRSASDGLLDRLMPDGPGRRLCDIGAGDSALAGWLERNSHPTDGLVLVDESAEMLAHSERWIAAGAIAVLGRASALPLHNDSMDLLVATLADPFDDQAWWLEVDRVLAVGGSAIVTLPASCWAAHFRIAAGEGERTARFLTKSGRQVDVPSYVRPRADEIELIQSVGLRLVGEGQVTREEISPPVSPKLELLGPKDAVVVAYVVTRD